MRKRLGLSLAVVGLVLIVIVILITQLRPKADVTNVSTSNSNAPAIVWGVITDSNNAPLSDIIILINGQAAKSNKQGEYVLVVDNPQPVPVAFRDANSNQIFELVGDNEASVTPIAGDSVRFDPKLQKIAPLPEQTTTPVVSAPTPTPTPSATPTPKPTPIAVTTNYATIGYLDGVQDVGVTTGMLFGWSYDPDAPSRSIGVQFYLDGGGGVGSYIGYAYTDVLSDDVNKAFTITGKHRYFFYLPEKTIDGKWIRDGKPHTIYAHGIDTDGTGLHNSLLINPLQVTLKPVSKPLICAILDRAPNCQPAPTPTPKPVTPTTVPTIKPASVNKPTLKPTPLPTPTPRVCSRIARIFGCR